MECDYSSHPYLTNFEHYRTTQARAPHSLSAVLEVPGRRDLRKVQDALDGQGVLEDLRLLGYEELGGLSDTGPHNMSCGTVLCEI